MSQGSDRSADQDFRREHPSPDGYPSQSSRFSASSPQQGSKEAGPPSRLRRYGAASFACQRLAWFTEPKLAEGERRMVAQIVPDGTH